MPWLEGGAGAAIVTHSDPNLRDTWIGCYDAGWKGLIADEAFAHPAKFSRNLIGRIYRHMLDRGWLAAGMTVVDPFGGVALGALDAMANGLHWTGCELEPKFHGLGNQNIAEWVRRYGHSAGWGSAWLLNGDSRRLCEVVGGLASQAGHGRIGGGQLANMNRYSKDTPGQLGSMKAGSVDAVLSSPPYADRVANDSQRTMARTGEIAMLNEGDGGTYGTTDGNLGNLRPGSVDSVISSPPYSERHAYSDEARNEARAEKLKANGAGIGGTRGLHKPSGEHPDNLAQLRPGSVDSVVSSPPYEGNRFDGGEESLKKKQGFSLGYTADGGYGDNTDGQLGNSIGETFWHAARLIVQQCHAILKSGGIAAWVTKDFVRNKARVTFSADWLKLCESCGFELVEWIHASLVKDLGKHADLYGDVHHKTVERKSFFRRLAEKKGSPRIDHEDVIFVRKAAR
jgi:hypothetical protein